jgi:hypothetical protein
MRRLPDALADLPGEGLDPRGAIGAPGSGQHHGESPGIVAEDRLGFGRIRDRHGLRDVLARDRRRLSSIRGTIEGAGLTPVACIAAPIGLGKGADATARVDHARPAPYHRADPGLPLRKPIVNHSGGT